MMSAEYPEIIPEPFNYPCTSYNGNAEDFMNDVVENCHASYTGISGYSDPPLFTSESSRHILIQGLTARQDHHLLSNSDREAQGRSSYSCEPNVVIVMKEPVELVGKPAVVAANPEESLVANINSVASGPSPGAIDSQDIENLLSIKQASMLLPQLSVNETSIPPCADRLTTPTAKYPDVENICGCNLRGFEIAKLEDAPTSARDSVQVQPKKVCGKPLGESEGKEDENLPNESVLANILPHISRRRTGSTLLQHIPVAHRNLHIPMLETRKLSDSALHTRRDKLRRAVEQAKQRCLSDTQAPSTPFSLDEDERESSAHGCDSGFHDDKGSRFHDVTVSSPRVSLQSLDYLSQDDSSDTHSRGRRVTPYIPYSLQSQDGSQSDDMSSIYQSSCSGNPGTMVHPRERSRRSLMKHYSQGSISGLSISGASVGGASSIGASSDSPSLSSILDCQSNATGVTDLLSSLGFDDFDSPQLVPDRFIPKDLDHLKPSFMKIALTERCISPDPPRSPDSLTSGQYSTSTQHREVQQQPAQTVPTVTEPSDLPLGATAENFLDYKQQRPGSPVPVSAVADASPVEEEPLVVVKKTNQTPLFTDTMHFVDFSRSRVLETVPEETASDLSPSPRWFSPRVSIDHSVHLDLAEGKLGASLNVQKARKRSLPSNREGYRWSIGSLVESDTGDSIHLSVTSYDDMIAAEREKERENLPHVTCDDTLVGGMTRRRRKGVYNPPQTLLSWLSTQKTIDEEEVADPDELPWPFNEQARLRKSLTEISLAQKNALAESFENDDHYGRHTSNSMSSSQRDLLSPSPLSTPNRLSPLPTLSEDEDGEHNLQKNRQSHEENRLRVSSPVAWPKDHPFTSNSGPSSLDVRDAASQELDDPYPSTVSLLQAERGSLATLPSEDCLTTEIQQPSKSCLSPVYFSTNHDHVDDNSRHSSTSSSTTLLTPPIASKEPIFKLGQDISRQSSFEKPEPEELLRKMSDDLHLVKRDGILDDLPASHISAISSVQTSCASRRLRFADRKQKSLESQSQELSSGSNKTSASRVRRKPVYGDAPSSPLDQFFGVSKEQKEVEKYMVL